MRTELIKFRASRDERETIQRAAEEEGMAPSAWIRRACAREAARQAARLSEKEPVMRTLLFALLLAPFLMFTSPAPAVADWNLHSVEGTMTSCGCSFHPVYTPYFVIPDWICRAQIEVAGPAPHFGTNAKAIINAELVEQAIGQCGAMLDELPRRVELIFWLEAHGLDFVHGGLVRSPIRGYYIFDHGPAD